jgi:hypothetical protein
LAYVLKTATHILGHIRMGCASPKSTGTIDGNHYRCSDDQPEIMFY